MTAVLDPSLAASSIPSDSFTPDQFLLVGPFKTSDGVLLAGLSLAKFAAVGMNKDGKLVAFDPAATDPGVAATAFGSLNFTAQPTAADTLTINSHVITFIASGATGQQVNIGASGAATAANVAAYINAHNATGVTAAVTGAIVTLEAIAVGAAGNSLTLAKSGTNPTLSGATLAGGLTAFERAAPEATLMGFLAQPIDATSADAKGPYFKEGTFNHLSVPNWPASLATLMQRRAACVGSNVWLDYPR